MTELHPMGPMAFRISLLFGPAGGGAARRHAMVTPRAAECALLRVQLYY